LSGHEFIRAVQRFKNIEGFSPEKRIQIEIFLPTTCFICPKIMGFQINEDSRDQRLDFSSSAQLSVISVHQR